MASLSERDIFSIISDIGTNRQAVIESIEKKYEVELTEYNKRVVSNKIRLYQKKYKLLQAKRIKIDADALLDVCTDENILILFACDEASDKENEVDEETAAELPKS